VWDRSDLLGKQFVLLALNGDVSRQPLGKSFLARIAGHFANEMAVITPNGKVLSQGGDLEGALKMWRSLPREQRSQLEDLGTFEASREPAPPPGGLVLNVFARGLVRDGDGVLQIYRHPKAHLSREAGRDHLWLTAEEWKRLVPPRPHVGDRLDVPAAITDRFCRRYLIDLVRIGGEGGPRRPENVREQRLTLTVTAVTADSITLGLDGSARFLTFGPENGVSELTGREDAFVLRGELRLDRKTGTFRRFDVVGLCETGHHDEIGKKTVPLGVAFTLTPAEAPADRVRPHSFYQDYFGKGR
jgi:hypothetical protein